MSPAWAPASASWCGTQPSRTMGPDELLLVLGHETGHYALHHIPKEFALDEAVALLFFFLGFFAVNWLVERAGPRTGVEGIGDLASLPLVLVVLTLLVFLSDPARERHLAPLRTSS